MNAPKWRGARTAALALLCLGGAGVAQADGIQVRRAASGNSNVTRCVGTLSITSTTAATSHAGNLTIKGVDSTAGCNSRCGDGVVDAKWEQCDPKANVAGCSSNCTWLRFPEYGGSSPYIDSFQDMLQCRNKPAPVPDATTGRDVTFLAFGDPQYGNNDVNDGVPGPGITKNRLDANRRHIRALNAVEALRWPSSFVGQNQLVSRVRGVIIAGDLAQEGDACTSDYFTPGMNCGWIDAPTRAPWYAEVPDDHPFEQYAQFRDEYGLCGNKLLKYPAFEGAGNHDYWRNMEEEFEHPIHKYIDYRNNFRQGVKRVDPLGKGHYSWNWDDVHFVQLNLAARDMTYSGDECIDDGDGSCVMTSKRMKPYSALTFLKQDLALHATSGKPVVLISHYPWVASTRFGSADRLAVLQAIKRYNVVALIHGHNHASSVRVWDPCEDVPGGSSATTCAAYLGLSAAPRKIPVIDAGNPFYGDGSNKVHTGDSAFRRYGHYSVVRITSSWVEASSVSWRAGGQCNQSSKTSCEADGCMWNSATQTCGIEHCLPGVSTTSCKPGSICEAAASDGGWTVRYNLANGSITTTKRPLYQYCPSP